MDITYKLHISSFYNGTHVYGKLEDQLEFNKVEITRPITQEEIDKDDDRFYFYTAGDQVLCHNSVRSVLEQTKSYADKNGIDCDKVVIVGLRNYKSSTLTELLELETLDFNIYCHYCKCVIKGAMYNAFGGVCLKCYDKYLK